MRVAIVGLGGIGASIGLGLATPAKPRPFWRIGFDIDPSACEGALAIGAVDAIAHSLIECLEADILFIATPPMSLPNIFQQIAPHIRPHTIVSDTASVKAPVVAWAKQFLPNLANFVGGHPIAGTEHHGWQSARAELFQGCAWALTPLPETSADALTAVESVVQALGAHPFQIDARTHDREMALLSHLPHALAFSLIRIHEQNPTLLPAGGSWRSATRVAQSDPALWAQILSLNREPLLEWLARLRSQLDHLESALHQEDRGQIQNLLSPRS